MKNEYYCMGRIRTLAGLNKECTFRSLSLEDGLDHHCPICGTKLLQQEIK